MLATSAGRQGEPRCAVPKEAKRVRVGQMRQCRQGIDALQGQRKAEQIVFTAALFPAAASDIEQSAETVVSRHPRGMPCGWTAQMYGS